MKNNQISIANSCPVASCGETAWRGGPCRDRYGVRCLEQCRLSGLGVLE